MTAAEDTSAAEDNPAVGPVLRLHPFSWLFVLITRLRPFILPAILLLFFGQGSSWELWGAVGAVVLAIYALIYSFGFRYQIAGEELLVREGVIFRTERHVPFSRVQSVVQKRNVLHLLFQVTELRLESAGGTKPEAVMNVIPVAEAERLELLLRHGATTAADSDAGSDLDSASASATEAAAEPLLRLPTSEVLRLGLISNRGWIVVGMFFGLWWQLAPEDWQLWRLAREPLGQLFNIWGADPATALEGLMWLVPIAIGFGLLLKPLSMVMTLLMFHDFRLLRSASRLGAESGLLTRRSASARADRIQRLVMRAPILARLLGRRTLACDVAVQRQDDNADELGRLHWLAPIATPAATDRLIAELDPAMAFADRQWQPLHRDAWRRELKGWVIAALIAGVVLWFPLRHLTVVPVLALLILGWFGSRGWARFAAWSWDGRALSYRAGWLVREWTTALIANGHSASLRESPFDRRRGMATIGLSTQGAGRMLFPLRIPYLPMVTARQLHRELTTTMAAAVAGAVGRSAPTGRSGSRRAS
ncbi:MAG: PH domain-containing protein [bacterium]|nr:PH domain-containing protein [bacterium]